MNNLHISVDYDGTIARTTCHICDLINGMTGSQFSYKDVNSWTYWQDIGLDKEFWKCYNLMDQIGRLQIQPYDKHVFDSLRYLSKNGINFNIVTANKKAARKHIIEWMIKKGKIDAEDDVLDFDVECLGRVTCAEKLSLPYNIYLDDNPNMADEIVNFSNKKMIIFNCPWNKNVKETNQVTRVESWKEVPELIKRISQ